MNDILRTFRLGVVNILGVMVPGVILLVLLTFGFLAPTVLLLADIAAHIAYAGESKPVAEVIRNLPPIGSIHPLILLVIGTILAYVIGYVIRLTTPDKLDAISIDKVLYKMEQKYRKAMVELGKQSELEGLSCRAVRERAAAADTWPHRGEEDNKFPYFHFRDYLEDRNHKHLAELVRWDSEVRSKTFVNLMKLETMLLCPKLSAVIESNEAHIRLLFGTWSACQVCCAWIYIGIVVALVGLIYSVWDLLMLNSDAPLLYSYSIWLLTTVLLGVVASRGRQSIESLFHYRRVRELFDIVASLYLARQPQGCITEANSPTDQPPTGA